MRSVLLGKNSHVCRPHKQVAFLGKLKNLTLTSPGERVSLFAHVAKNIEIDRAIFQKEKPESFSLVLCVDPTCRPYNIEEIFAEKYLFIQNTTVACYPLVEVYSLECFIVLRSKYISIYLQGRRTACFCCNCNKCLSQCA